MKTILYTGIIILAAVLGIMAGKEIVDYIQYQEVLRIKDALIAL